jgi:tetrahydromethanopterin S-methyltransferase subunit D
LEKEIVMVYPKLRRVLAASALVAAVSLVPVGSANAAVHARAHRAGVACSRIEAGAAWLWDLVVKALVGDAGVRIDPDGNP